MVYDFGRKEVDYFWKLHGVSNTYAPLVLSGECIISPVVSTPSGGGSPQELCKPVVHQGGDQIEEGIAFKLAQIGVERSELAKQSVRLDVHWVDVPYLVCISC